jgi:hypothetical protein
MRSGPIMDGDGSTIQIAIARITIQIADTLSTLSVLPSMDHNHDPGIPIKKLSGGMPVILLAPGFGKRYHLRCRPDGLSPIRHHHTSSHPGHSMARAV